MTATTTETISTDVLDQITESLSRSPGPITPPRVAEALRALGRPAGDATVLAAWEQLLHRKTAEVYGPIQDLIAQDDVAGVIIRDLRISVDHGSGYQPTERTMSDDATVRRLAQRIASNASKRLDDASPFVDTRLNDGTRLEASLGAHGLPTVVRLTKHYPFTNEDRVRLGLLTPAQAALHHTINTALAEHAGGGVDE